MKVKIRKAFDRERSSLKFHDDNGELLEKCLVEQHHTDDTLVQNILKKYDQTGIWYHTNQMRATYQDNTIFNEYQDMFDKIKAADEHFANIPAEIRAKFDNDTGKYLEFVNNDDNIEAMYEMGILQRPIDESEVQVTQPPEVKKEVVETPTE